MKKILATILTIIMTISATGMTTVFADDIYSKDIFAMTEEQTRTRGFLIVDGDICNLNGDVIINMTNGLTATGNELAPIFRVSYPQKNTLFNGRKDTTGRIAEGTFDIPLQSEKSYNKVGGKYTPIAGYPDLYIKYDSGTAQSINVGVVNQVTNQIEAWCNDIAPGEYAVLQAGTMSNPHELTITANGKAGNASITACLAVADNEFEYAPKFFADTSGHWAEEEIRSIASRGIIDGYPDGTFKPDAPITRAEFAKIATLAFNLEPSNTKQYYADLDGGEWFYTYAQAIGFMPNYLLPDKEHPNMKPYIYDGYNANFLPNENAVRMHIAEALSGIYVNVSPVSYSNDIHKLAQEVLATFNDDCYKNLSLGSENADKMIKFTWIANNLGIMQGDDNGNFNPYGYVTRAELVTMIDRMLSATDNSNLLKHNKTINLNPNSSTQLEELIVENGYGYWTFDIHNNSESPVKILITKDTPTGEQIGDLVRAWQKENKTIDCGGIPLADGVYYLSITTNGEHYFDGSIDISLSNQAN